MFSRIIAFFISQNINSSNSRKKAVNHFDSLVDEFKFLKYNISNKYYDIFICYEGDIEKIINKTDDKIEFCVGPLTEQYNSGYNVSVNNTEDINDRFLKILVSPDGVEIINDYAGTIPVYYSMRNYLSLSNIEPVTVLDSNSGFEDISYENMFGYLKFSHYIWDETLYRHIFVQEPDALFIYKNNKSEPIKTNLNTLKRSDKLIGASDKKVAEELYLLNEELVTQSLQNYDEVILPLSAGYDSRLIFASLSKNKLVKDKLKCFTYGPYKTMDVESAKMLTKKFKIYWKQIDFDFEYLKREYLNQIGMIFGGSLHFHGMYQFEFYNLIKNYFSNKKTVITSGFMTGVPAGQHISLLNFKSINDNLVDKMNNFGQSSYWLIEEFLSTGKFKNSMLDLAESRFRRAFNKFDGTINQKSVLFDIWTRQRNFIAYYPRTFEWKLPHISPHMSPKYINFFLSLSDKHLIDRKAVELMLKYHYPELFKIPSGSHNGQPFSTNFMNNKYHLIKKVFRKLRINKLLPDFYNTIHFDFDVEAVKKYKKDGFWPVFDLKDEVKSFLNNIFPDKFLNYLYEEAISGNGKSIGKLVEIEALSYSLKLLSK